MQEEASMDKARWDTRSPGKPWHREVGGRVLWVLLRSFLDFLWLALSGHLLFQVTKTAPSTLTNVESSHCWSLLR